MSDNESELARIGHNLAAARAQVSDVMKKAREAGLRAIAAGMTETDIARLLGVDRMTVRQWQGKRRR